MHVTHKLILLRILDGEGFIFDGKTTVAVPEEEIPGDFGEQFTVSTWIQTRHDKGKQVVMANTDKQEHNRIHFALIKNKNKLTVIHRLEPIRGDEDDYCNSDFHYKPDIFDNKWHHLTVVVDRCSVKLYVDGQHQVVSYVDSNYRMHKSKISAGLFVGAHWLGREKTFTQFFKGKLAGMAIRLKKTTAEQVSVFAMSCLSSSLHFLMLTFIVSWAIFVFFLIESLDSFDSRVTSEKSAFVFA